jgi:2-keto-myo-inositol isomerase
MKGYRIPPLSGKQVLMLSRRAMLLAPVALLAARRVAAAGRMTLAMHQNTSSGAGYRGSLEGWARAGIRNVELTNTLLDGFLKTDSLQAARRVVTDLGLTPVMCASGVFGIWEPGEKRAALLDNFKRRCEQFAMIGLTRIYTPSAASQRFMDEDFKTGPDRMREVGDIAKEYGMTALIEATRASTYVAALPTMLSMTRASGNVQPLLDCYHFWSGPSKLEDLDLIRDGEIGHVHFQDVPDIPRELLDQNSRFIPGDGIAPLNRILRKLSEKEYSGPLSVELFLPKLRDGDPFEVAREIRQKCERVMRQARVM